MKNVTAKVTVIGRGVSISAKTNRLIRCSECEYALENGYCLKTGKPFMLINNDIWKHTAL